MDEIASFASISNTLVRYDKLRLQLKIDNCTLIVCTVVLRTAIYQE